ncbi:MAG: hypothetical protein L3J71_06620 [Victivallaceae bacterium]|nr:hypothetical protein [Victivallaceae bacterium]
MILLKNKIVNLQIKSVSLYAGLALLLLGSGCSSIIDAHKQKKPYMALYYGGELNEAAKDLVEKSDGRRDTGDELAWRLDEGTALFTAGDYKKSLEAFRRSEELIADFDQRAVVNAREAGANVGMAVTNLNALPYRGFCVDRIMLNAYKALDYFAEHDTSGALVELRRMRDTQKTISRTFQEQIAEEQRTIEAANQENRKTSSSIGGGDTSMSFDALLKNSEIKSAYDDSKLKSNKRYGNFINPFATYFSAIGYLIENNYGEALVDFRNLYKMDKANSLFQRDFVTAARMIGGRLPPELEKMAPFDYPLHAKVVFVLFFNGRGPALKQVKFQIVLPFVGYAGFAFPRYEYYPVAFSGIELRYSANKVMKQLRTITIADFDAIMSQEYHQRLPTMITRLVISGLTKELASAVAVYAAYSGGGVGGMLGAMAVTGVYKYLFNTADTRCWETLPKEVQVVHFPRPENGKISFTMLSEVVKNDTGQGNDKKAVANKKPSGTGKNSADNRKNGSKFQKKREIVLQKDSDITIIYIRALSEQTVIYKVFEVK